MFTDALEMSLVLTIGGTDFSVPGANIKSLACRLHPYGFTARLNFWVSEEQSTDELFPQFVKKDLIEVKLLVNPHLKPEDAAIEPLTLQGLVRNKALLKELTIENINLRQDPVLYRQYQIDFADPARVLWRQHFPCDLLVDGSVKDLIEANKASGVELQYDWDSLDEVFAINVLSPGTRENGVSLYDFIVWFTSAYNGIFSYDSKENRYTLGSTKNEAGQTTAISELEVAGYRIDFPAAARYNDRFLNAFSEDPKKSETSRDTSKTGVKRDVLVREPIASDFEKAFTLESNKTKSREHQIFLIHGRFPLLTYRPGTFIKFEGGLWSDKIFLKGNEYRVRDIIVRADAVNASPDADHNMPYARYSMDMHSQLELKSEAALNLPPFKSPAYPIYVEGKIVSEQGKAEEETYQIYKHPQTDLDQYKVKIPLFDNKQVVVPFEPLFAPGHFYFPAYKEERVLVALDFHSARLVEFLDWRPDGRLPMDTQGNHLLLGKGADSITSINHVYVDNKPQLNVKRVSIKDTEVIQLHEGRIVLQTKEESS